MILGITGTIGAGKGTVAAYLESKGYKHISVSEFLAGIAQSRGLEPSRVARRDIGNEYRMRSATALIEAALAGADVKGDLVVESLHTVPEVEYIRARGGKVISVDAPFAVRYERIQRRGSVTDHVSFEEFAAEQDRQMASANRDENNLAAAIAAADFHIENASVSGGLFEQIDAILQQIS